MCDSTSELIKSVLADITNNKNENSNRVSSREIIDTKFEILVDDLSEWLGKYLLSANGSALNPLKIIFDKDKVNIYAKKIINDSMITNNIWLGGLGNKIESIKNTGSVGIKELVKECREKSNLGFNIIFWSLFIIAVDENAYNEKLSDISDIAYMVNFTEEMLEDWITALRLILEGKDFKNYLYSSKEANKFFGHR